MKQIELFRTPLGREPFRDWFEQLEKRSQIKILVYIERLASGGSRKNIKSLGEGVYELKIDFGPGYRVYFGQKNETIILLLIGGNKDTQARDILLAKTLWRSTYVS